MTDDTQKELAELRRLIGPHDCRRCADVRWVCETHPDRPWDKTLPGGCQCGAGDPCPDCNRGDPPTPGFEPGMKQ